MLLTPSHVDPVVAVEAAASMPAEGSSGWIKAHQAFQAQNLKAELGIPADHPMNIVLGLRIADAERSRPAYGCFSAIEVRQALGAEELRRPRTGEPPYRRRARELTPAELHAVKLITPFESRFPLLEFIKKEKGFVLRPHRTGIVVAGIPWAFPPFAKKLIAEVEIAHEDASSFEFAMCLTRPDEVVSWVGDEPASALAFSGWLKVERRFELHRLELTVREIVRSHANINIAIRLPEGANPVPSHSFWRRLLLIWDE